MPIDNVDPRPPLFGGGSTGTVSVEMTTPLTIVQGGTGAMNVIGARHSLFTFGGDQIGDIYVRGSGTALSRVAAGASGNVLTANGPGVAPSYQPSAGGPSGPSADTVDDAVIANLTIPTQMTAQFNVVTGDGAVRLPAATVGGHCFVHNSWNNPIEVRPAATARINRRALDEGIFVPADTTAFFKAASATQWYTVP